MEKVAVWSEFVPFAKVKDALPRLGGAGLHLAVREGLWETEEFFDLWKEAALKGVEIRAWLLLPKADGYWPNRWNLARYAGFVRRFLKAMDERGLTVPWLVMDLEPPPNVMEALLEALQRSNPWSFVRQLRASSKRGSFTEGWNHLDSLVKELQARGTRVHAVTIPLVLHGLGKKIEAAFGIPFEGINFDAVSFMVYRPEFERLLGKLGPDLVHRYAREAFRLFGDRAAIDVGEVGKIEFPFPLQGFRNPAELRSDASAAFAGGVNKVHTYSLDGMLQFDDIEPWLEAARTAPHVRPKREWKVDALHAVIRTLGAFLPKPDKVAPVRPPEVENQ